MEEFKGPRLFFYNLSSAGHALFERIFVVYTLIFFLPPDEYTKIIGGTMKIFLPENLIFGLIPIFGFILILGRAVDAVADPLIASLSDRSKSKLGRRRIFLLVGGLPLALSTVLIFFPPFPPGNLMNAFYLALVCGSFWFFYTVYVAPYISLIPELKRTERGRQGVATWQAIFMLVGAILVLLVGPNLQNLFLGFGQVKAYQYTIIVLSIVGCIFLYFAVFAVDEKKYSNAAPSSVPLFESIKTTLKNKYFIIFLLANMTFWYIFNTISMSIKHIAATMSGFRFPENLSDIEAVKDILAKQNNCEFLYMVCFFGGAFIFFIVNWFLGKKINKKYIMLIGLILFAFSIIGIALTGIVPVDPVIWAYIFFFLCGYPVSVFLVMPNVFISESCDYDFKQTGQRREAMYFGVHGFFVKFNLAIASAVAATLLAFFGKSASNPLGIRLSLIVSAVVAVIGFFILLKYPLNLKKESEQTE